MTLNNENGATKTARRIQTHDVDLFASSAQPVAGRVMEESEVCVVETTLEPLNTPEIEEVFKTQRKKPWLKIWLMLALVVIGVETGLGIWEAMQSSFLVGVLYSSLALLSLGLIGKLIVTELKALWSLKRLENVRLDAERLLQSEQVGEAEHWLKHQLDKLPSQDASAFKALLKSHHTDKEALQLFDRIALTRLDDEAQKVVTNTAAGTALLVALSPMATVDMLAVLWRGTKMIESISRVYGIRLGYRSRLKLYKLLLTQMVFVGGTELISDLAVTTLSAELLGKLSARSAQGLSAGIFTARLGLKAMELCRPLPHLDARPVRLKNTIKQVFHSIAHSQTKEK